MIFQKHFLKTLSILKLGKDFGEPFLVKVKQDWKDQRHITCQGGPKPGWHEALLPDCRFGIFAQSRRGTILGAKAHCHVLIYICLQEKVKALSTAWEFIPV